MTDAAEFLLYATRRRGCIIQRGDALARPRPPLINEVDAINLPLLRVIKVAGG